jgi:hypothetical protein
VTTVFVRTRAPERTASSMPASVSTNAPGAHVSASCTSAVGPCRAGDTSVTPAATSRATKPGYDIIRAFVCTWISR